jgi:hypothetical protein
MLDSSNEGDPVSGDDSEPHADPDRPDARREETRTTEVIQQLVMQHRDRVRACYDAALKDHPGIKGNLTIHFTIDPKGAVSEASLNSERSDINVPALTDCATAIIRELQFPKSSRGFESTINYPFNFNP